MTETFSGKELTCRQVIEFVQAYLDGELALRERAIFDMHLKICPDCVNYLKSYQSTQALSKRMADAEPEVKSVPNELVQAILAARKAQ